MEWVRQCSEKYFTSLSLYFFLENRKSDIYAVWIGVLEIMFARWVLNKGWLSLWTTGIILDTPWGSKVQWSPWRALRSIYLESCCTLCYETNQPWIWHQAWHLGHGPDSYRAWHMLPVLWEHYGNFFVGSWMNIWLPLRTGSGVESTPCASLHLSIFLHRLLHLKSPG